MRGSGDARAGPDETGDNEDLPGIRWSGTPAPRWPGRAAGGRPSVHAGKGFAREPSNEGSDDWHSGRAMNSAPFGRTGQWLRSFEAARTAENRHGCRRRHPPGTGPSPARPAAVRWRCARPQATPSSSTFSGFPRMGRLCTPAESMRAPQQPPRQRKDRRMATPACPSTRCSRVQVRLLPAPLALCPRPVARSCTNALETSRLAIRLRTSPGRDTPPSHTIPVTRLSAD